MSKGSYGTDYERIAKAISYIKERFREQPDLEQVAKEVHLSQFHFQRLFNKWAGVSPKKFLEYISIQHAEELLRQNASLADASYETGLSGTSRLHDLFINIERMTPGEFKNKGENLSINYSFSPTPFGKIIVASTSKGICYIAFADDGQRAFQGLHDRFPNASYKQKRDPFHRDALRIFQNDWRNISNIKLHLKGTPFQLKVWEALLKIPFGRISTYAHVAETIGSPTAARAVGTAIGDNPVAYLIPCHRVIRSTGVIGDYHWGNARKSAIVGWEAARTFGES
ncbi:MAG: methylated-DNA--[protein]-cysteine S-methyltransferase [Bacteroidetes bacterium]|nr:methylated-DNA--[protein]-cysteine S-methyltransferase [Bacteroidota bacterium]MCL5738149.1 methylated-DNA--[protein]-cysteine S-methyltransferase [Bacteroidota bacterium]